MKTEIGLKGTGRLVSLVWRLRTRKGVSPEESAASIAYLAMDPNVSEKTGLYWKDRQSVPSSADSYSTEDAAWLWELSEKLCGTRSIYELHHASEGDTIALEHAFSRTFLRTRPFSR